MKKSKKTQLLPIFMVLGLLLVVLILFFSFNGKFSLPFLGGKGDLTLSEEEKEEAEMLHRKRVKKAKEKIFSRQKFLKKQGINLNSKSDIEEMLTFLLPYDALNSQKSPVSVEFIEWMHSLQQEETRSIIVLLSLTPHSQWKSQMHDLQSLPQEELKRRLSQFASSKDSMCLPGEECNF